MKRLLSMLLALFLLFSNLPMMATAQAATTHRSNSCVDPTGTHILQGTLQGANYTIAVPAHWNGTLLLYSHGYVFATSPLLKPAPDASDPTSGAALLQQGYALAGSSYSSNGWALQQAFHDQIALLNFFTQTCGHPARTIAWGDSLGGIITAGLLQLYPNRFSAALPMCGVLSGGIGTWNQALDSFFAFNALLAGGTLPVVHLTQPATAFSKAQAVLTTAQTTPQGRARIALVAALGDIPGWFNPSSPEPAAHDTTAQEQNQFLWEQQVDFAFAFFARTELEARAGGNPSWNVGVNYRHQLEQSSNFREVTALYAQAGLRLDTDLDALAKAPRISADKPALNYLNKYITFNGDIDQPVLSIHTTGDGLVVNPNEQAYDSIVDRNGDGGLLRQVFIHRAGHCTFTPAEKLTAMQTLVHRLNTGSWSDTTDPDRMNREAQALGPTFNIVPPSFISFKPSVFLRPFNGRSSGHDNANA